LLADLAASVVTAQLLLDRRTMEVFRAVVRSGEAQAIVRQAEPSASTALPMTLNLLHGGLLPTFYEFTEADLRVPIRLRLGPRGPGRDAGIPSGDRVVVSIRGDDGAGDEAEFGQSGTLHVVLRPVPPPLTLMAAGRSSE
jgi:hypothetical protein